ncbi:MAG: hypothetical protein MUE99_01630 [Chitinophagaceae bacterium]|nr:hypothetical protein [Chitinophagaceae bacterium]
MPNRQKDDLFQLIKSLGKGEKRNFKLYAQRHSSGTESKSVILFDALDKMQEYDEETLLSKNKRLTKLQLSNIKAALYKQILSSLRMIKDEDNIDLQLHELMDQARILYNKGLYLQSLKALERHKVLARQYHQVTSLAEESDEIQTRIRVSNDLSNLSLQLYAWYIKHGHARNRSEATEVKAFFDEHLPKEKIRDDWFYCRLYLFQSHCWLAFIRHDFLTYYKYAQRWVDLFDAEPQMLLVETIQYIKGMHNLLGAHYDLRNRKPFFESLKKFELFYNTDLVQGNDNFRIQTFVYLYISKINSFFFTGEFPKGCSIVPEIEQYLTEYSLYMDRHRVLVFYYKIACLYFGAGNNEMAVDYLNRIIHLKVDLRTDLQCYARLLHLIAHFELGNSEILPYLAKNVYRFMAKMENLSHVEEAMFKFLRTNFHTPVSKLKPKFEKLLHQIKPYEKKTAEARAFAYLDVISWLESRIEGVPVETVIRRKFEKIKEK